MTDQDQEQEIEEVLFTAGMSAEKRAELQAQIDAFLSAGGVIEQVPPGASGMVAGLPKAQMNQRQLRNAKAREQAARAETARFEMVGVA
jgi:hypothetical protein